MSEFLYAQKLKKLLSKLFFWFQNELKKFNTVPTALNPDTIF